VIELAIELDIEGLKSLVAGMEEKVGEGVRETAFLIERGAKERVPVDTGALKNSIQTVVFGQAAGGADALAVTLNPSARILPLPEPENSLMAIVGASVDYAAHVEYGTVRMAAQPFLEPAMAEQAPHFEQRVANKLSELL